MGGRTARNAEPVDPAIRTTHMCQGILECEVLVGTRSAEGIMASGHVNRIKRPNTWLHRPMLQNREESSCQTGAVHTWHFSDLTFAFGDVCSSGWSGHRSGPPLSLSHLLLERRGGVTETFHRRYSRCANRGRIAILSPGRFRSTRQTSACLVSASGFPRNTSSFRDSAALVG